MSFLAIKSEQLEKINVTQEVLFLLQFSVKNQAPEALKSPKLDFNSAMPMSLRLKNTAGKLQTQPLGCAKACAQQ